MLKKLFLMPTDLGKIFGIPIILEPNFKLFFTVMLSLILLSTTPDDILPSIVKFFSRMVAIFTIVLLHELGHALATVKMGHKVASIRLNFFGGMAEISDPKIFMDPVKLFILAIAGPLVNVILLAPLFLLGKYFEFFAFISYINLLMLLNLLPLPILDGSRILLSFFLLIMKSQPIKAVNLTYNILLFNFVCTASAVLYYGLTGLWVFLIVGVLFYLPERYGMLNMFRKAIEIKKLSNSSIYKYRVSNA